MARKTDLVFPHSKFLGASYLVRKENEMQILPSLLHISERLLILISIGILEHYTGSKLHSQGLNK